MFNIESLNTIIQDESIKREISINCKDQFKLSFEIQSFVNKNIIANKSVILDNNDLDLAIKSLFSQAVRTYKSCVLLVQNGYVINSIINLRNLVEITFNINYIITDNNLKVDRARLYLKNNYHLKVSEKSMLSLDTYLYKLYRILCEYSHGNFLATKRNIENNLFSTYPTSKYSYDAINIINSIYLYCINSVCSVFDIDTTELNNISKPNSVNKVLENLNYEKSILNLIKKIIEDLSKNDSSYNSDKTIDIIKDFNKYRIDKNKKKYRKKARN